MRRLAVFAIAGAVLLPADAAAHRLDEYLHASRLALGRDALRVEMDLAPGVSVAPPIVQLIDRDGDGRISGHEAEAYARAILGDVTLGLDEQNLTLTLQRVEISPVGALLDGTGTISIVASARVATTRGAHHAVLRNDHRSPAAVYLANALVPESPGLVVASQTRDPLQRELRVDYEVVPASRAWWMLVACLALGTLGVRRVRATVGSRVSIPTDAGPETSR